MMSRGRSTSTSSARQRGRTAGMRRWDGQSRITTDWFGYHNDPELNFTDGDVLVFLHEPVSSRKRASFRLHADYLATTGFQSLVDQAVTASAPTHWALPSRPDGPPGATIQELFLPPPPDVEKDAVPRHHLATRNFFAWLYDRPMTGKTLGASLEDVMNRVNLYRPGQLVANQSDMIAYLTRRGYLDFRECPDHALAALHLAEKFQIEALWVNAFAHCVGMNLGLHTSVEFNAISRATKAIITRARLEMDIRLDQVARSLTTFFDNDLSGSSFGLTQTTNEHMDRFRSFLHAYYIESHGFWPPSGFESSFALRRSLYRSMYMEFRALYQYLADTEFAPSLEQNSRAQGGICTLQTIRAFDERQRFEPLPRPLPLLPKIPQRGAPLGFTIKKRRMERETRNAALLQALNDASNRDPELLKSRLVSKYHQFEKQTIADDFDPVTLTEGRKVRWILVYAILQILASVISAPKEVGDTEGLSYPLCCQRPRPMPWMAGNKGAAGAASSSGVGMRSGHGIGKDANSLKQRLKLDVDYLEMHRSSSSTSLTTASSTADSRSICSATSSAASTVTSKSLPARSLLRFLQKEKASPAETATATRSAAPASPRNALFHELPVDDRGKGQSETIDDTPKIAWHPPEHGEADQQRHGSTRIDNSSFVKTFISSSTPNSQTRHITKPTPLSLGPHKFIPPRLQTANLPLPDSPTVPFLLATASSTSRSSANPAKSRLTPTRTSFEISSSESLSADRHSIKSINTTTSTSTLGPNLPSPDILHHINLSNDFPTPKLSPKLLDSKSLPLHSPSSPPIKTLSATTSTRTSTSTIHQSPPPPPPPSRTNPSISILSSVAGKDAYLSLPSGTGSGRMALPKSFMRSYSGNPSIGSMRSVNVIREETEVN